MREIWVRPLGWDDPLRRERLPIPVFWPGEFHGVAKSWTWLSDFHFSNKAFIHLIIKSIPGSSGAIYVRQKEPGLSSSVFNSLCQKSYSQPGIFSQLAFVVFIWKSLPACNKSFYLHSCHKISATLIFVFFFLILASGPITSWEIDGETVGKVSDFIFWGSKITADGDCSHEIKRRLLLGRKVMINLDSILKSRDITSPTKVHLVKAMVFPVVMYGCESWTVKKAECRRTDAFELWCWRRLLRVLILEDD